MAPGDAAREKRDVWSGRLSRTRSGLTKSDLMLNKAGKVVSKRQHAAGKRLYQRGKAEGWLASPFTRGGGGAPRRRPRRARQVFTNRVDDAAHHGRAHAKHMRLPEIMHGQGLPTTAAAFAA